jgi:hypothetical protein
MNRLACVPVALALCFAACSCGPAAVAARPGPAVPEGLGVNIHFTDAQPGEMDMLAAGGSRIVRMDFAWGGTEREKGRYDFSAYDRLMMALEPRGIRALFILDYSNKLYDNDLSPCSDEGRAAFARWAAAAAVHFQGRGILWEMYNEPNIFFWRPKPDVAQYAKLALAVGKALREAAPGEAYIGPASSTIDLPFLEACFKAGLLDYWSAVSVHPYRQTPPETVEAEYAKLRRLIDQYAPAGKAVPILSGEWGYSSAWSGVDDAKQGKYLPRQWLTNLACDVPVSIWYDWHDDGQDPKEGEHHFGTVAFPYQANRTPPYEPKPAYLAARTLTKELAGYRFNKRLAVGGPEDRVLLFTKGPDVCVVAWTTAAQPHVVVIPASLGAFVVTGHTGDVQPALAAGSRGLEVMLTDAPQYLAPETPNDLLRLAAGWERAPAEIHRPAGEARVPLGFENPLARPVRVSCAPAVWTTVPPGGHATLTAVLSTPRDSEPRAVRLECEAEGIGRFAQSSMCLATNPLIVTVLPPAADAVLVRIENPSGDALAGSVGLSDVEGLKVSEPKQPLRLKAGEREKTVRFPLSGAAPVAYRLGVRIEDEGGHVIVSTASTRYALVDDFARYTAETLAAAYGLATDGDKAVASTQTLSLAAPPEGPPAPGVPTLKIAYAFEPGWKFIRLAPRAEALRPIEGEPRAFGLWLYGDGSGNIVRLRFTDSTGQTFQPGGDRLTWKGWRYVQFPMQGSDAGHWGGENDGVVHWPVRWDTLLLIDSAARQKTAGEVYLAWPVLVR